MMTELVLLRDPNKADRDNINKFWTSFTSWYKQSKVVEEYFKCEYKGYDNFDGGTYYPCINFDQEYKIYYGVSYPEMEIANEGMDIEKLQDFIEIMYDCWVKTDKHYEFTKEINKKFDRFHLSYRLSSGKLVAKGYKTSEKIEMILNQRMFERKIAFAEQMITSGEMLDKKCALDYIVDSLQYYISIQNASDIKKKYSEAAKTVNDNPETKTYSVVKNEIDEIMKISNEYFDIRHNEYLNKSKEKRETLDDSQFIEYLYNRVYGLLFLLRLKVKQENLLI